MITLVVGSRFENKTFDANAVLAKDGKPASIKTFVATVNGTLETAIETSPIASTTTEIIPGAWDKGPWINNSLAQPHGRIVGTNTKGTYICASEEVFSMISQDYGETWAPTVSNDGVTETKDVAYSPELNRAVLTTKGSTNYDQTIDNPTRPTFYYSDDDGRSWVPSPSNVYYPQQSVAYGYGQNGAPLFVSVGWSNQATRVYTSVDGITWVQSSIPSYYGGFPYYINNITYSNGRFVKRWLHYEPNASDIWYSDNGYDWQKANVNYLTSPYPGFLNPIASNGKGTWVTTNDEYGVLTSTNNAVTWQEYAIKWGSER